MSSATVEQRPAKVGVTNRKENENNMNKARRVSNTSQKKHKHEDTRHFKFGRKRLQCFPSNGKFISPYKRRKKDMIPPTKFLLGGNICDPLNLNSMQDEEVNRAMNAVTPKSSPLPTPKHRKETIEVIIPPNIHDPLNLINCSDDDEYEKQLISPVKKTNKKRNRKRKRVSSATRKEKEGNEPIESIQESEIGEPKVEESAASKAIVEPEKATSPSKSLPQEPQQSRVDTQPKVKIKLKLKGLEEPKDKRLRKLDSKDKIVSPVIPQPGAWKPRLTHRPKQDRKKKHQKEPNFNSKNARFQYGNYNRYYGYRNLHNEVDPRLTVLSQRKELFCGKDVLDIGCNIGHITLSVARDFGARSVTGIDIDKKLINIARKNVKHYVNCVQSPASEDGTHKEYDANYFPTSMLINYGPVDIPGFTKHNRKGFPYNVTFVQGNYVLEDEELAISESHQFDVILCLSITKWIHLNFGDSGLQMSFRRMFNQLRPGGVLILEPQNWNSYTKKKGLTEKIYKNYKEITFFPNQFTPYLLSSAVGFTKCEVISVPPHHSKGFQRPIYLYTKALANTNDSPIHVISSPLVPPPPVLPSPMDYVIPPCLAEEEPPRNERRQSFEQQEHDRREYERELFPSEPLKLESPWDTSNHSTSQRSGESLSHYEHLENVYAPSATPCYDTPQYNLDSMPPPDPENMCYLDVSIEHNQLDDQKPEDLESEHPPKIDSDHHEKIVEENVSLMETNQQQQRPETQNDNT